MAIPANVEIIIDNGDPLKDYHSIRIEQELFNHHYFQVTVPYEILENGEKSFFNQAHNLYCGKPITIKITSVAPPPSRMEFKGIITSISLSNADNSEADTSKASKRYDFNHRFVLSGYSSTYLLEDGAQRRPFVKQTLGQIFAQVLDPYPSNILLRQLLIPQHYKLLKYTVQYGESSYAFLRRLANEYGEWFYYDGTVLHLGLPNDNKDILDFSLRSDQVFDLAINLMPSNFDLTHYDYLTHEYYKNNSASQPLPQLGDFTSFALGRSDQVFTEQARLRPRHPIPNQEELNTAIQEQKESQASRLVIFKGSSEDPVLTVGRRVKVGGRRQQLSPHDYGEYRLTKVTHVVNKNMYYNKFEGVPAAAKHPPTNPLVQPPQAVPELAKVIDIADPAQLGRVKVCYSWPLKPRSLDVEELAITDWIRVSTPYSGTGKGQLFTPEVGSQVLVGYEEGRPEFPVVLGNLFHNKNPDDAKYPPGQGLPQNEVKGIQTAGGNKITFHDKKGQERILISNKKQGGGETKLEISFTGTGEILLKTKGKIKLEADEEIVLNSKRIELNTKRGGDIVLNTNEGDIELKGSLIAIESTHLNVEAAQHVRIDAVTEIMMKSQGTTELSSSLLTTIKGNPVRIN